MEKVVFSKAQLDNQSKLKKAVAFATHIKAIEILSYLFKQALGNEISVYKEVVKQYFKNPQAPLSFLRDIKMQGSPKEHTTLVLPSCPEEWLKMAEKCLANSIVLSAKPKKIYRTRKRNPNHRKYPLLMQGKLA
jgi:hypothetical protein